MRSLPSAIRSAIAENSLRCFPIIRVDWGEGGGVRYYAASDRTFGAINADGRIESFGVAQSRLARSGSWSFSIKDHDGAIRALLDSQGDEGHVVDLILGVHNVSHLDWPIVWSGVMEGLSSWDEDNAIMSVACIGAEYRMVDPLGYIVELDEFATAHRADVGQSLPVAYGRAKVEAIWVKGGGPASYLTTQFPFDETSFRVADSAEFPAGTIQVWVGRERVEGSFSGNRFNVTDRNLTEWTGDVQFVDGESNRFVVDTSEAAGFWVGLALRLQYADWNETTEEWDYEGTDQYRTIRRHWYDGATEYIELSAPFQQQNEGGSIWAISEFASNMSYTPWRVADPGDKDPLSGAICYARAWHRRGVAVRQAADECVFVVNDRASAAVDRVFVESADRRTMIPSSLYTVKLNDSQFAAIVGRNVTTVTFKRPPELLMWDTSTLVLTRGETTETIIRRVKGDNNVTVSLRGAGGVEHPIDIMRDVAIRAGFPESAIDEASITAAKGAKSGWRAGFVLTRLESAPELIRDIARMVTCSVDYTEGEFHVVALRNDIDLVTPARTIAGDRLLASLKKTIGGRTPVMTVSRAEYAGFDAERLTEIVADPVAMARYGRRENSYFYWAYPHRNPVRAAASFWLYRERFAPAIKEAEGGYRWLALMPGDVVVIDGSRGWIEDIDWDLDSDKMLVRVMCPPTAWYDAAWVYPSPVYVDPPPPHSDELAQDRQVEPFHPSEFDGVPSAPLPTPTPTPTPTPPPTSPPTTATPTSPPTTATPTSPPEEWYCVVRDGSWLCVESIEVGDTLKGGPYGSSVECAAACTAPPTSAPTTATPTGAPTTATPTGAPTTATPTDAPTTYYCVLRDGLYMCAETLEIGDELIGIHESFADCVEFCGETTPTTATPTGAPTTATPTEPPTEPPTTATPTEPPTEPPTTATPTGAPTTATPTGEPTTATPTGEPVDCNECDPPLPASIKVTFSDMGGDFAAYNGEHAVEYLENCQWFKWLGESDTYPLIYLQWQESSWLVTIDMTDGGGGIVCQLGAEGTEDPCDPEGTFDMFCLDENGGCIDSDTCAESVDARVMITLE